MNKENLVSKQTDIKDAQRELVYYRNSQSVSVEILLRQLEVGYNELSADFLVFKERVIKAVDRSLCEQEE